MTQSEKDSASRGVIICVVLSICAGIWLGIAARIAMRLIALEAGTAGGFSSGGSLEVILFGAIVGIPVGLLVWMCRSRWRVPFWFGTVVGVALFAVMAVFQPPAARSALTATPDRPLYTALLFAVVFASYGAVLDVAWAWKNRKPNDVVASM